MPKQKTNLLESPDEAHVSSKGCGVVAVCRCSALADGFGPIVGTRTWGGLVGIGNGQPLRDGGFVTAPGFAFFSSDNGGEWIVEQHGVDPDYVVPQRPDLVVSGHDPQLEKASELAKEALKDYQGIPPRPKYPSVKE